MQVKIALVSPPIKIAFRDGRPPAPLGLMYLASQIEEKHEIRIFDFFNNPCGNKQAAKRIAEFNPDVVGISTIFSSMLAPGLKIAGILKTLIPDIITVFGGNQATFLFKELVDNSDVDYVVLHEGEWAFRDLVDFVDGRSNYPDFNVASIDKKDPKIVFEKDINNFRPPIWKKEIFEFSTQYVPSVLTSRGCPFTCSYCSTAAMWSKKYRTRNIDSVIKEIEHIFEITRDKKRTVILEDDLFTLNNNRVEEFCEKAANRRFTWGCSSRLETVNSDLLTTMAKSGCISIFFGLESGSSRILQDNKRKYCKDDIIKVFNNCRKLGISTYGSFIIGLPDESIEDVEETFSLMWELDADAIRVGPLQVLPGTPIWNDPDRYGIRLTTTSGEDIDTNNKAHFSNGKISLDKLTELNRKGRMICQKKRLLTNSEY